MVVILSVSLFQSHSQVQRSASKQPLTESSVGGKRAVMMQNEHSLYVSMLPLCCQFERQVRKLIMRINHRLYAAAAAASAASAAHLAAQDCCLLGARRRCALGGAKRAARVAQFTFAALLNH